MTVTDTLTRLRALRELLSAPERWTQGVFSRDAKNRYVFFNSSRACKWDLWGGWEKLGGFVQDPALIQALGTDAVSTFNDTHTHAEVIALIDGAIGRMEAQ